MAEVKQGDTVKVHYTGKLDDGTVFDSSQDREPLEFTTGSGMVIPGFDNGVIGMAVEETKTINIQMDNAYGPYLEEAVKQVPRSEVPDDFKPEVGQQFQIPQENGQAVVVLVTEVTPESITLDANHPLAGKDLVFDLTLVEIVAS